LKLLQPYQKDLLKIKPVEIKLRVVLLTRNFEVGIGNKIFFFVEVVLIYRVPTVLVAAAQINLVERVEDVAILLVFILLEEISFRSFQSCSYAPLPFKPSTSFAFNKKRGYFMPSKSVMPLNCM
jgi:hypothetical protein